MGYLKTITVHAGYAFVGGAASLLLLALGDVIGLSGSRLRGVFLAGGFLLGGAAEFVARKEGLVRLLMVGMGYSAFFLLVFVASLVSSEVVVSALVDALVSFGACVMGALFVNRKINSAASKANHT